MSLTGIKLAIPFMSLFGCYRFSAEVLLNPIWRYQGENLEPSALKAGAVAS